MARYEHLPVFKKAMELTVYLEQVVRNFSRYHKYGIGAELRQQARQIIGLIIKANSCGDKTPTLRELATACEQMKMLVVLTKELKAFQSFKSFQHAANLATSLCRQSEGWYGSSKKSRNHQPHSDVGR